MAITVGLAAARHLDDAWAVLEHFGQSDPIKCSLHSFSPKVLLWDHWPPRHKLWTRHPGPRFGPTSTPACRVAPCASVSPSALAGCGG